MRRFEHHIHEEPKSFFWKYVISFDHKIIGMQFFWFGLAFLALGGFLAILMRWQLAYPNQPVPVVGTMLFGGTGVLTPDHYNVAVTMHGTIMVFFAITPLLIGAFGNYLIPLQIGARDMAFPFLNMLSFWMAFAGGIALLYAFVADPSGLGKGPQAGWTGYPPLSSLASETSGPAQNYWILALFLTGAGSIMGAVNYITTILLYRAPGMTLMRMPLTTWGLFYTAILNALYVPVIASGLLMLLMDRVLHTSFFAAGPLAAAKGYAPGGQVLLYQHVFWVFGHPEVYIVILPAWGMVSDFLAIFSRKPAFGYRETVIAMGGICVLSACVWGHHMFVSGMNPYLGRVFTMMTLLVSIPSAIFFLNWLGTLWRGSIRFTSAMLFSIGVIFVFSIGGLTGMFNASQSIDLYIHDTYFVVGHFHLTMAASVLLGGFAGLYFWFPKMFGRMMNETLGKIHFALTLVGLSVVFILMFRLGAGGHMRRIADPMSYSFLKSLGATNVQITHAAFTVFVGQIVFLVNLVYSLFRGPVAPENPWDCTTLEWTTTSPPPHYNFKAIPTVHRGPFEYSNPEVTDRDWIAQTEPLTAKAGG